MNWQNIFTQATGISYPVIQAPMLGVTTPQMVAAISNAGGLGSLPVGGLSPARTRELIRETKKLTAKPFAVNLFTHALPEFNEQQAEEMQQFLIGLAARNNLQFTPEPLTSFKFYTYQDQIEILIEEHINIISFTFGILDDESITRLKSSGTLLIGTATSLKEARILDNIGIDMIVAQGIEAGGHRGSFIEDEPLPQTGLMSLLIQITDHIQKPVIAAGGMCNGKSINAALKLGAVAVQPGTIFVASDESLAIPAYKLILQKTTDTDSVLTRAFSGRWARGIRNQMLEAIDNSGITILPYPYQNSLTTAFRAAAQKQNNADLINLWTGQCGYTAQQKPSAEIFKWLIDDTERLHA